MKYNGKYVCNISNFENIRIYPNVQVTSSIDPEYIRTSLRDVAAKHKDTEAGREEAVAKVCIRYIWDTKISRSSTYS